MVKFIAEVSSNHHRDLDRCFQFIDTAAAIGCYAVKFQLFKIDQLFAPEILQRSEQHRQRKEWELPVEFLPELAQRCRQQGIKFCCTPFYLEAVDELLPYVDFYKIASYELLWDALIAKCSATHKPVVLSTGMANLDEIQNAVAVAQNSGCQDLTLLQCVSGYPAPAEQCNLAAIETIRQAVNLPIGWSDHSVSQAVIYRAVHAWRAEMVEFHLDLDRAGEEYQAGHCWLPEQIAEVIQMVNEGMSADGGGVKAPVPAEIADRDWRADPSDGLRPLRAIRDTWYPENNG